MTDAHCHVSADDSSIRELVIGRDFVGIHPWDTLAPDFDLEARLSEIGELATAATCLGIGEIGLDRLKVREVPDVMRTVFQRQLAVALARGVPVVLHGAKCWGQVVREVVQKKSEKGNYRSNFLFHGFSRSDGLIPEIVGLGGFISVGPSILNDHAVNYRKMVKLIPRDRLLIETDRDNSTAEISPTIGEVAAGLARILGIPITELEALTDENADKLLGVIINRQ